MMGSCSKCESGRDANPGPSPCAAMKQAFGLQCGVVWIWGLLVAGSLFVGSSLYAQNTNGDPNEPIPQLRPPHGEIPPTFWEQYAGWVCAGGVVLTAVAGLAVWFACRPRPEVIPPPREVARRELEPLRAQAEDGALLSRVSQVLRQYIVAAFELEPGELTTTEFCLTIAGNPRISPKLATEISDFLRRCDERKFSPDAQGPPLDAVATALRFVESSEARLAELRQAATVAAANPDKATATP
jgi:hypothetical protein